MQFKWIPAQSVRKMRETFDKTAVRDARVERFYGTEGKDAYNPSVPFRYEGKELIAARVEARDSEHSEIWFFERKPDGWYPLEGAVRLPLQDPTVAFIGGQMVLGGVNVTFPKTKKERTRWKTDFYVGTPYHLEKLVSGPDQMKDVRLVELANGSIALTSRPQGALMKERYGCISKIGYTTVDSLSSLTARHIEDAPYLEKLFCDNEWGGANQLILLRNGKIGVVGHMAYRTRENYRLKLHYCGMAFVIDPERGTFTQPRLIVTRECFPETEKKRADLGDVTFTGGIVRNGDGTATVYSGLSDAHIGSAVIPDPFAAAENS